MSYEVLLSPEAIRDLQEIYRYIASELQSPQNAATQLARLEQRIYTLNELPLRHRVYDREPWRSRWRPTAGKNTAAGGRRRACTG